MGVHASCFSAFLPKQRGLADTGTFLGNYTLGRELGQGAFGTVYSCTSRQGQQEYAVKRIRKYHSLCESVDIDREVDMLRKLAHPSVVQLHDVYSDARFVDVVLDVYKGGDMFAAAELHLRSKGGDIPIGAIQSLTWQMFRGIDWLHQNNVVHRDIKGDNFLLDRVDLEHPECRVYLSDFGTAVELKPEERLHEFCGTEWFWAPEIYRRSYALTVDVWAAGITSFVLLTKHFPFANRKQIRRKRVKAPPRCCQAGASFMLGVLERDEAARLSARACLAHPFLASAAAAEAATVASCETLRLLGKRSDSSDGDDSTASGTSEAATETPSSCADECLVQRNSSTDDDDASC